MRPLRCSLILCLVLLTGLGEWLPAGGDAPGGAQPNVRPTVDPAVDWVRDIDATPTDADLPRLVEQLHGADGARAEAAALALADLASPEAAEALRSALRRTPPERRHSTAAAAASCADALLRQGELASARRLFDALLDQPLGGDLRLAAIRGAILSRGEGGRSRLVRLVTGTDPDLARLGMGLAVELPGGRVTTALTRALPRMPEERQIQLLEALAARGDVSAVGAILRTFRQGRAAVKVAVCRALVRLPDPASVPVLLEAATADEGLVGQEAIRALAALPGDSFDRLLAAGLARGDAAQRLVILEVLARRQNSTIESAVLEMTIHEDRATRLAALRAAGWVVSRTGWPSLVGRLLDARDEQEIEAGAESLGTALGRAINQEDYAGPLIGGLPTAPERLQIILLTLLGRAGGAEAREALQRYCVAGTPARIRRGAEEVLAELESGTQM